MLVFTTKLSLNCIDNLKTILLSLNCAFTTKLSLNCQCNAAQSCDLHIYISLRSLMYGMESEATRGRFGVTTNVGRIRVTSGDTDYI